MNDVRRKIVELDLNDILPNRFQPRIKFNEEAIIELCDSIKEHGVIQPIVVRPIGDKYEIIAGERRYKASVLAGKLTIPAIITDLNDKDSAEVALIENVQRRDLTPIEEAISYKKILDMGYLTQEQLAQKLGKSQSAVANKIRLLNLCDEVQEALMEEKISERHARSLLKLQSAQDQRIMLNKIIENRYTVRKTDEEIKKMNNELNNNISVQEPDTILNPSAFNPSNPGFVDVNKIEQQAQELNPISNEEKMDLNMLLQSNDQTQIENNQNLNNISFNNNDNNSQISDNNFVNVFNTPLDQTNSSIDKTTLTEELVESPSIFDMDNNKISSEPSLDDLLAPNPTIENINGSSGNLDTSSQPLFDTMSSTKLPSSTANNDIIFEEIPSKQDNDINNLMDQMEQWNPNSLDVKENILEPHFPSNNTQTIPNIPLTPIIDQSNDNRFFGSNSTTVTETAALEPSPTVEENVNFNNQPINQNNVIPEPIIITDYSKQYDPVIPNQKEEPIQKIEFKQIINLIRDLSTTIEKCGYFIDTEEFDMDDIYQVIFKINKKDE